MIELEDEVWMGRALSLARIAGDDLSAAVLVKGHRCLAEAATRTRPEAVVLARVKREAAGATLYLASDVADLGLLDALRRAGVERLVLSSRPEAKLALGLRAAGIRFDAFDAFEEAAAAASA
ncbi:MAG: hypothetical protein KF901_27705 [Myxococcales bacterium]|nr:hypothetical protein [Myxococcales bacterium]